MHFTFQWSPCQMDLLPRHSAFLTARSHRFSFSSSVSPNHTDKEANQSGNNDDVPGSSSEVRNSNEAEKTGSGSTITGQSHEADFSLDSKSQSSKRMKSPRRTEFSDSDAEADLSIDDLVKLVAEKEELLKLKHKEIEKMQDKVLRSCAEVENVIDRTKREAENSKKFAIQVPHPSPLLFSLILPLAVHRTFLVNLDLKIYVYDMILCRVLPRAY